MALVKFLM